MRIGLESSTKNYPGKAYKGNWRRDSLPAIMLIQTPQLQLLRTTERENSANLTISTECKRVQAQIGDILSPLSKGMNSQGAF